MYSFFLLIPLALIILALFSIRNWKQVAKVSLYVLLVCGFFKALYTFGVYSGRNSEFQRQETLLSHFIEMDRQHFKKLARQNLDLEEDTYILSWQLSRSSGKREVAIEALGNGRWRFKYPQTEFVFDSGELHWQATTPETLEFYGVLENGNKGVYGHGRVLRPAVSGWFSRIPSLNGTWSLEKKRGN